MDIKDFQKAQRNRILNCYDNVDEVVKAVEVVEDSGEELELEEEKEEE